MKSFVLFHSGSFGSVECVAREKRDTSFHHHFNFYFQKFLQNFFSKVFLFRTHAPQQSYLRKRVSMPSRCLRNTVIIIETNNTKPIISTYPSKKRPGLDYAILLPKEKEVPRAGKPPGTRRIYVIAMCKSLVGERVKHSQPFGTSTPQRSKTVVSVV